MRELVRRGGARVGGVERDALEQVVGQRGAVELGKQSLQRTVRDLDALGHALDPVAVAAADGELGVGPKCTERVPPEPSPCFHCILRPGVQRTNAIPPVRK